MEAILNYIKGVIIGAGAILPGVSSGVMCVAFGIYEKIINIILDFKKDLKRNIKFIIPIVLGVATGVVLFGNVLKYLLTTFYMQAGFVFIGLILGNIPILFKQANKGGFRLHYLLYLGITFILSIVLILIERHVGDNNIYSPNGVSFGKYVLSGFLMSAGIVIPGISSSVILMVLGIYNIYLGAIATINIPILFPIGIGALIGGLIFLKGIKVLLEKKHNATYYGIIGFVFGSIPILYPGISFDLKGASSIICFILGYFFSKFLEKINERKKEKISV